MCIRDRSDLFPPPLFSQGLFRPLFPPLFPPLSPSPAPLSEEHDKTKRDSIKIKNFFIV